MRVDDAKPLKIAGLAALVGCVGCCALPLLAMGGGSGALGLLLHRPGIEFVVGGGVFVAVFVGLRVWSRLRHREVSCEPTRCEVDGSCCQVQPKQRS